MMGGSARDHQSMNFDIPEKWNRDAEVWLFERELKRCMKHTIKNKIILCDQKDDEGICKRETCEYQKLYTYVPYREVVQ